MGFLVRFIQSHHILSRNPNLHSTLSSSDIRLNLLDPNLRPDTKYAARVRNALRSEELPRMRMRIVWQAPEEQRAEICASSVAKHFADAGYAVRLVQTEHVQRPEYSLRVPLLGRDGVVATSNGGDEAAAELFATAADVIEYAGMVSLGCEMEADSYLSGYSCAGRSRDVGQAAVGVWRGMFTSETVQRLLDELR